MKTIEIFDPAMCCPTGLCGPNINPNLMRIAAAVQFLQKQGVNIKRHNLRDEPQLYVSNTEVNGYLQEKGAEGLPVVLVDGAIAVAGEYPTNEQLTEWTGIALNFVPINQ
jgi:hypothetical protein